MVAGVEHIGGVPQASAIEHRQDLAQVLVHEGGQAEIAGQRALNIGRLLEVEVVTGAPCVVHDIRVGGPLAGGVELGRRQLHRGVAIEVLRRRGQGEMRGDQ